MSEAIPDLGSRYTFLGQLGQGGMSVVYLVEDPQAGRRVAMKVIAQSLQDAAEREEHLLRFKQEFRTMARLKHPNTCEVYDYGVLSDGRPYLTMEVVEGHGLDACIPLSPDALLPILRQVGQALQYIHQQGFVHLDLKPENIRLREDGTVKLMDFGLMEVAGQSLDAVRGTLPYLSPEVARLDRVDARSDIYSLGALTYHLLTGTPPFTCSSALEYLRAHLTMQPRPLSEVAPAVPSALRGVVERMLQKEAGARYASADAVLAALGHEPTDGGEATVLESSFVGRSKEAARLQDLLGSLVEGKPNQVAVVGPTGVGKSRLLGEFRVQVLLADVPWLHGRGAEGAGPYATFAEVLRGALPLARQRCPQQLHLLAPTLAAILPELDDGRETPLADLEPPAARTQLQQAVVALLVAVAGESGAVLVLDDAHQMDALSVALLDLLRRQVPRVPLLIVAGMRERPDGWDDPLELSPLSDQETAQLVSGMLGLETPPDTFASSLREAAGGRPGIVITFVSHLVRNGHLKRSRAGWTLPDRLPVEDLPQNAADMLLSRLDQAQPGTRALVRFAAVFAEPFSLQDARALAGLSEDDLFDALEAGLREGLLGHRAGAYALASGALRRAVYGGLEAGWRTRLHLSIARHLEATHVPAAVPLAGDALTASAVGLVPVGILTAIAGHYLRGDSPARAVRWSYIAADRNLEVLSLGAATDLLTRGLALAEVPEGQAPATLRFDFHNALATCYHWLFSLDPARTHIEQAELLLAELDDGPRRLEWLVTAGKNSSLRNNHEAAARWQLEAIDLAASLGNRRTGVRARVNLGRALYFLDRRSEAREVYEAAVQEAQQASSPSWRATALSMLGYLRALTDPAGRERGTRELAEAISVQESIGDKSGLVFSSNLLFELQLLGGALRDAETSAQRCVTFSGELGVMDDHVVAHLNLAIVLLELGELERSRHSARDALSLAERHGHLVVAPLAMSLLGLLDVLEGRVAMGLDRARSVAASLPAGSQYVRLLVGINRLEALVWARHTEEAGACIEELMTLLAEPDFTENHVRLALLSAELAAATGAVEESQRRLAEAVEGAERLGAQGLLTRARTLEALLLHRLGSPRQALQRAEEALEDARRLGSDWYLGMALVVTAELHRADDRPSAASLCRQLLELARTRRIPRLEALAQFGVALNQPGTADAESALARAQQLARELAAELDEPARQTFERLPEVARILDHVQPVEGRGSSRVASEHTFQRLQEVNRELATIAGQYDKLVREWTIQSEQLQRLNEFARQINHSLRLETVLDQAVLLTLELTSAERGFLYLLEPEAPEAPRLAAAWDARGFAIPEERGSSSVLRKAIASGELVSVTDTSADEAMLAQHSITALNLRSVMCVPLRSGNETLGALYVDSQAALTTFTESELALLVAIAGHTAVSIRNAMLYQSQSRRAAELKRLLEQYRRADFEASTDELTGLRNRRFFEDQAGREVEISRRYGRPMSVVMLDVDHFKWFNDTHGHAQGDDVLRAIGRTLAATVRSVDLPARYGGEELLVLCPDTDASGAAGLAERIRLAVAGIHLGEGWDQPLPHVTCSLGVAAFRSVEDTLEAILARADAGLYAAKAAGRNCVRAWMAEPSVAEGA